MASFGKFTPPFPRAIFPDVLMKSQNFPAKEYIWKCHLRKVSHLYPSAMY